MKLNPNNSSRSHRTALVVDGDALNDVVFQERVRRLEQSTNGQQIKVDYYVRQGDVLTRVSSFSEIPEAPVEEEEGDDVKSLLSGLGYVQILIDVSGNE